MNRIAQRWMIASLFAFGLPALAAPSKTAPEKSEPTPEETIVETVTEVVAPKSAAPAEQITSALIGEQLEKPITLDLQNATLPQALERIETDTGIPLRVPAETWNVLPWGRQTPISAEIKNAPLRNALGEILGKLGLQFVVKDESIDIVPLPPLARLGKRATIEELRTIDLLRMQDSSDPERSLTTAEVINLVDQMLARIDDELRKANRAQTGVVIEQRADNIDLDKQMQLPRNLKLYDALEVIDKQTRLTWYPWGKSIVIRPKKDVNRERLEKQVTVRYEGEEVTQVLSDLSSKSGLPFSIEPGAVQRVPPEYRGIRLYASDASVRQTLESLSAFTGLGYVVTDDGVYIWNNSPRPAGSASSRVVATVNIGNGIQIPIREDQLPEAVRAKLAEQVEEAIRKIEEALGVPTTQPAQ